ncbi:hypothetical protein D3C86_1016890 [compost metagenome]
MTASVEAPCKVASLFASLNPETTACLSERIVHYMATINTATILTSFLLKPGYKEFTKTNMVYFGSTLMAAGSINIIAVLVRYNI